MFGVILMIYVIFDLENDSFENEVCRCLSMNSLFKIKCF